MEMMTPTATQITSVTHSKDLLVIEWADGETSRLDALWLRDHCQMPTNRNPDNGQRLLNVIDIPEDLTIAGVEQLGDEQLEVTFLPENHSSRYTTRWLRENCYCINAAFDDRSASNKTLWQGDSFSDGLPSNDYTEFTANGDGKVATLRAFSNYGFALLTGVPCESGQVLEVIGQIGSNRNTIQLLHCLSSSASGGDSILVDGFRAAEVLRQANGTCRAPMQTLMVFTAPLMC